MQRAWVRAPLIEGPAPSAALCEATPSWARSPASFGGITAGHRRSCAAFGASCAATLAGFPRCGWQVSASGWCEKHPNVASDPGRALGTVPRADPARRAYAQLRF